MRFKPLLAAVAALLLAGPAAADITARYTQLNGSPPIVVQVSDGGDSRARVTDATYLTTGGASYLVVDEGQGGYVVRLDDFASLMAELLSASGASAPPPNQPDVIITEEGTEVVAGRTGRVYVIGTANNPSDRFEIVICPDADLAPLGRAMALHFGTIMASASRSAPGVGRALVDLLGRGTVLRIGDMWRLESIEIGPVPPSAFALPSAPISREELLARLRAGRQPR